MQPENTKYVQIIMIARNFCSLMESSSTISPNQFLFNTQGLLLELFLSGRILPEVKISEKEYLDLLKDEDYKTVLEQIASRCPFQYYNTFLDPFDFTASQETGMGDIVDDLGDIYRDLKRALMLYDSDSADKQQDALWQIKFSFDHHWSAHCIDAVKAIQDFTMKD